MPRLLYKSKRFGDDSLDVIDTANTICREYQEQGFDLTLRQLYYQFVARGLLPNNDRSYKRLGSIVNDARLAGLLDWDYIVDRTRNLRALSHWDSPSDIVSTAANQFRHELWRDQPCRVEVWIEKDALIGVIAGVCEELDVPYFSCRGYTSQSEVWSAAQRLGGYIEEGQQPVILHLGDHDPSGVDMTRDITDRLNHFTQVDWIRSEMKGGTDKEDVTDVYRARFPEDPPVIVERIALTMAQVDEYDPPPNPAKLTDARARGYIEQYGNISWELDALDPPTLAALIRDNVEAHIDRDAFDDATDEQLRQRSLLKEIAGRWSEIEEYLQQEDA